MTTYSRDVAITDALTGKLLRTLRVTSPTPISKSDALHAVIRYEDKRGKN